MIIIVAYCFMCMELIHTITDRVWNKVTQLQTGAWNKATQLQTWYGIKPKKYRQGTSLHSTRHMIDENEYSLLQTGQVLMYGSL